MNSKQSKTKKIVAGIVGLALVLSFAVAVATPASAATVEELTAQINSLLSTIASLQAQLSTVQTGGTTTAGHVFSTDLTVGSKGADVTALQQILVAKGYLTMPSGVAYGYFGSLTKTAVAKWQAASGISPAAGYVGPKSRAALNAMGGTTTGGTTGGTTVTPTGGTLAVSAGMQPAAQLAPESAARVPFTNFTLTAGSSDVTVNSVTVTRVGPALDSSFSGVILIDQNGNQIGVSHTLNSNHQATIGATMVVKAGTSMTYTVAGNMAADLSSRAGEVPAFQVTSINTSAPVVGSLPITGTGQTINFTLAIGQATIYTSSFDPNGDSSQNIGTTAYRFAGIRVTAGSGEDLTVHSIVWNQSGSASASDLANVVTVVDGTQYPTVLSSDGKYYTTQFGNGIVIAKGFSKDIYVQGDLVGSGAANRTVEFDLYRSTDLYVSGNTYNYGITPTPNATAAHGAGTQFTTTNPWFSGSVVTIQAGSVTTVTNATSVPAQNVAVNVPNQPLGGFTTNLRGEPVSIQQQVFHFNLSTGGHGSTVLLTSVTLVDQNGAVVAGPVDAEADTGGNQQKVTFTDSVTFPTTPMTYTLKGKVPTGITGGVTITASTTPSSDWTNVTGQTTGNTILLTGVGLVTMNPMTVRTASLAVSASTNPAQQAVIAGTVGYLFTNLQLDASQSGEDVRFSSIPLTLTSSAGAVTGGYTGLTGCQLFNGATALNNGSNVVNPTDAHAGAETFTLDSAFTVPKGTVQTLSLKCNIASNATGTFHWDMTTTDVSTDWATSVTGVTSSQTVTPTGSGTGATMSIGTASLAVSADSSSPSYTIVSAGSTGVTLGVLKFRPTNDSVNLQRVVLKLTNTASSTAADLVQVTLWDGSTQVGSAIFTGTSRLATSTLSTPVLLARDTDHLITIKGDLSSIGSSQPVTMSGHLVAVDIDSNDSTGTYGNGVGSGATVNASGSTAFTGVRVFKTVPTLAAGTLPTSGVTDGRLLRFSVTADSKGPVGIAKFLITLSPTAMNVTNINMFGFTDSAYSQPISGVNTSGQLMASNQATTSSANTIPFYPQNSAGATTTIQVPAGQTRYFEVRGTITPSAGVTNYSVVTTLNGDSAYPLLSTGTTATTTVAVVDGSNNLPANTTPRGFIWSANSTTTSAVTDVDWSNGYGVLGLPSSGIIQSRTN